MLRKQRRQNQTANTLRGQIEERRRRKEQAAKLKEQEERREEERIERERRELEQRYAKQARAEQAQRNKETNDPTNGGATATAAAAAVGAKSVPTSPKTPSVPSIVRSVSAPEAQPGAPPSSSAYGGGQSYHATARSPVATSEEEEQFRQEMQIKQQELEAQLQLQKDLVAQMQATMAQAIEAQRLRHAQHEEAEPTAFHQPAKPARRQWASSPTTLTTEDVPPPPLSNPYTAASAAAAEPALTISPTRYSHEWAAQMRVEAQQSHTSFKRPPLPVQPPRSRAMPNRPVDPAFASRPKIVNSLDEADMASVLHSSQQYDMSAAPLHDVSTEPTPSIRRRLGAVEQSLDSQSKLVHVSQEYAAAQASGASLTFMGKTWAEPQNHSSWTASTAVMPPAPLTSAEPLLMGSGGRPASQQGGGRSLSLVEQSLASSSKLIFLKSDVGTSSNTQAPRQRPPLLSQPRRLRPGTAASIPTTIPEEPASSESTVSSDTAAQSLSHGDSPVPERAHKLGNPSTLPSIAWDENAPPANHPYKDTSIAVTPQQEASTEQGSTSSPRVVTESASNPSPSMKVVASFLGVNPVIPSQVSPPLSHLSSPVATRRAATAAGSPATPPREDLKFRVHTPTRKDREAMQQSMNRFEATEKLRFESTESTPEVNL